MSLERSGSESSSPLNRLKSLNMFLCLSSDMGLVCEGRCLEKLLQPVTGSAEIRPVDCHTFPI